MPSPLRFLVALAVFVPLVGMGSAVGGLEAAAEAALAERFPDEAHRLDVRVLRTGGDVPAAALRVRLPASAAVPRGYTRVDVLARARAGWQKAGWALVYVAHFDSVVVARRTVERGAPVAPNALGAAWLETTTFHGEPLRTADLARLTAAGSDLFAKRRLREGRALRRGDLRPPFAADTGDAVTLRFRRGVVALELPCHAREPGYVGDEIKLYSPDTDATYRARLLGPGLAEWTATL
jgi:flagella basal body P-ring formation protein FlgA